MLCVSSYDSEINLLSLENGFIRSTASTRIRLPESNVKGAAFTFGRVQTDTSSVLFGDLLANSEPDARALILVSCIETPEQAEEHVAVVRIDTNPFVLDADDPLPGCACRVAVSQSDTHAGGFAWFCEFDTVGN